MELAAERPLEKRRLDLDGVLGVLPDERQRPADLGLEPCVEAAQSGLVHRHDAQRRAISLVPGAQQHLGMVVVHRVHHGHQLWC